MKEIKTILQLFNEKIFSNEKCAIAQVVKVEGSSYRREGARMIVFESGIFEGGISGGCLEGDALKRSQLAILKQKPSIVTYDTSKEQEIGIGLGCNGIIDVLMTPVLKDSNIIKILDKCAFERKSHVVVTITSINENEENLSLGTSFYYDTVVSELDGMQHHVELQEFTSGKILEVLDKNRSNSYQFSSDKLKVNMFIELIPPQFHVAIYGDNYDVYPMIEFAKILDWEVSLVGNIQKLKKEKIESVENIYHKDYKERPKIDERTAVILMSHDFKTDSVNLQNALKSSSFYIASLGPRKRYEKIRNLFKEQGHSLTKKDEERIHAPSGLEIGANTPEEIAMSIMSEILSAFSGKTGAMLKNKIGPIHHRN